MHKESLLSIGYRACVDTSLKSVDFNQQRLVTASFSLMRISNW